MGEAIPFRQQKDIVSEKFRNKIENILQASSFPECEDWVLMWRNKGDLPALQISLDDDTGGVGAGISEELCTNIVKYIGSYIESDPQFPYTIYTFVGNEIIFRNKED